MMSNTKQPATPRRKFTNTLLPHAHIIARAERYARALKPLSITACVAYAFYLMLIVVLGSAVTYSMNLGKPIVYTGIILAVATPVVFAMFMANYADKIFLQRRRLLVEDFLRANDAIELTVDLMRIVEPQFEKYGFELACKNILKKTWLRLDMRTLTAAYNAREAFKNLYPIIEGSDICPIDPEGIFWVETPTTPIILFGSKEPYAGDWMAVAPLNSRANYSSLYLDALSNGSNVYLDQSTKVRALQLEGTPYTIYAGLGGDSDAYMLLDKMSFGWLKEIKLPLDFEVFNNRLIIRQSLPSRSRFGRKKSPETLFNPTTIQNIFDEILLVRDRLERNASAGKSGTEFKQLTDVWHNRIAYSRHKYIQTIAKRWTAYTVLYVISTLIIFCLPVFFLIVIESIIGHYLLPH